jgi:hypothetical protein
MPRHAGRQGHLDRTSESIAAELTLSMEREELGRVASEHRAFSALPVQERPSPATSTDAEQQRFDRNTKTNRAALRSFFVLRLVN